MSMVKAKYSERPNSASLPLLCLSLRGLSIQHVTRQVGACVQFSCDKGGVCCQSEFLFTKNCAAKHSQLKRTKCSLERLQYWGDKKTEGSSKLLATWLMGAGKEAGKRPKSCILGTCKQENSLL